MATLRDFLAPAEELQWVVDEVSAIVDSVHHVKGLRPVPVLLGPSNFIRLTTLLEVASIELDPGGNRLRLSLLHEVGHLIDLLAVEPRSVMSSSRHPLWREWREAVLHSPEFLRLARLGRATGNKDAASAARYNQQIGELWARSYAQFVTNLSGDDELIWEMSTFMHQRVGGIRVPRQWADESFLPIQEAISEILEGIGWRSSQIQDAW